MRFNKIIFILSIIVITYFWFHYEKKKRLQNITDETNFMPSKWSIAMSNELPNVPFFYWEQRIREMKKYKQQEENTSCAPFPDLIEDIQYHNNYWQMHLQGEVEYYLYSAFYDNREHIPRKPIVRLLSMIRNRILDEPPSGYCQIWFKNKQLPSIVPVHEQQLLWKKDWNVFNIEKYYLPYFLTCAVPETMGIPQAVSFVNQSCAKATNIVKIHNAAARTRGKTRNNFAVCVKGMNIAYEDYSARLVEWLELQRILGAHKVYIYEVNTHPNVKNVLAHYQGEGFIELKSHSLIASAIDRTFSQHIFTKLSIYQKRFDEVLVYNDCFYRHLNQYRYIAMLDVDEALIPLDNILSWQDLVDTLFRTSKLDCPFYHNSLCFRHMYFPSNFNASLPSTNRIIPNFMHMLQYIQRVTNHSRQYFSNKCFHSTENVVAVHNHFPLYTIIPCAFLSIPVHYAQLQHYRFVKNSETALLKESIFDRNIWRWKDTLIERTQRVLNELKLLN